MTRNIPARKVEPQPESALRKRLTHTILEIAGNVPDTDEHKVHGPERRARAIAGAAANKAALTAGTLALPPGPLGWLTILPELTYIWRIQSQMVADIAGAYGASAGLTRSHMLHCLFRHAAAQALRDIGAQVGARLLIQDVPLRVIERTASKIGVSVSKRIAGQGIARWLPVIGAVGVGAYAYYDTAQVARSAIALFGDSDAHAKSTQVTPASH